MFQRLLAALALVALVPLVALAGTDPEPRRITIVDGDGHEHVITLSGSAIEVVSEEDGELSVHAFDFAGLEPVLDDVLDEAMTGLDEAMAELEALDLSISVDGDMIVMEHGDAVHAVNVQFLSETVGEMIGEVMAEFDGSVTIDIDDHDHGGWQDLDRETEELRAEVRALKKELKELTEELARR